MSPQLSIIIPCYNSENTLEETLLSVVNQNFSEWEAIIVNDGSNDSSESIALRFVEKDKRFKYFYKKNGGLGKARNFGIHRCLGDYILPLDSDNMIMKDYLGNAVEILENQPEIGVVHGYAEYFGENSGIWKIPEFEFDKILIKNAIDACAIYRKSLWKRVGGYDENMPHQGNEDWLFWIEMGKLGVSFLHLKRVVFKYRVSNNSMINSFTNEMFENNIKYIADKNSYLYYKRYSENFQFLLELERKPFSSSLLFFKKGIKSLIANFFNSN